MDGGVPGREVAYGGEPLLGGGEAGLDCGDLAEPSLFLGLLEPVEQVLGAASWDWLTIGGDGLGQVRPIEGRSARGGMTGFR
ncbi:hypothetical protein J7I94_03395 [Streptomyces sp. ISL-12]|uniref:hypothetical protein n=1 Tax=Streptomyces sp. ISL-12 TaxID=2819177 RepID=UPI001BEA1F1D|nr:hypothetical protein [Streptomyces sp. ISL-12]MBT2409608.1 hypothetical protein [Streptomyces sp. ISL-12]